MDILRTILNAQIAFGLLFNPHPLLLLKTHHTRAASLSYSRTHAFTQTCAAHKFNNRFLMHTNLDLTPRARSTERSIKSEEKKIEGTVNRSGQRERCRIKVLSNKTVVKVLIDDNICIIPN